MFERACHYNELFVQSEGWVYPCCRLWSNPKFRIGNIDDPDIFEKILAFDKPEECKCEKWIYRKKKEEEKPHYTMLNIELSLACQAKCVMCCVGAPDWKGEYNKYDSLNKLVEFCQPDTIKVQGGEVLIQKESMGWLHRIKTMYPETSILIVTNGSVSTTKIDEIEKIFDAMTLSMVGFQELTYNKIMGLNRKTTFDLIEEIGNRGKTKIFLKFLLTPLNIHEADGFIVWGAECNVNGLVISYANMIDRSINLETAQGEEYWTKIFAVTGKAVRRVLRDKEHELRTKNMYVAFDRKSRELYGIDKKFVDDNNLNSVIRI